MSAAKSFQCSTCGAQFKVPEAALAKYPGWTPKTCLKCRDGKRGTSRHGQPGNPRPNGGGRTGGGRMPELNLSPEEVLERFHAGPKTGIFTDGSANPNPGPGGWGVVYVVDDEIIDEAHGHEPHTTNNRMELTALIEAYKMGPKSVEMDVYSDSNLCVQTVNEWAAGWERRGWRRKSGAIKNLELVQELWVLAKAKPNLKLHWIRAHDGSRWNEYADALSTAYTR